MQRKFHGKAQQKDRDARDAIAKWQQQQPSLDDICADLARYSSSLTLQPGLPNGSALVEHVSERGHSAKQLLATLDTGTQNLKSALTTSFDLKCRTVTETFAPHMATEDPVDAGIAKATKKKPPCYQVGYCICGAVGDGSESYSMCLRIILAIKLQFPKTSHYRDLHLRASRVFLLLRGLPNTSGAGSSSDAPQSSTHVWHIGILYLTPFRPTFRKCELANPDQPLDGPVDVIGTDQYSTLLAAVRELDTSYTWHARLYYLRESDRPLELFDPSKVTMVPYQADDYQVWPKPGRPGNGRRKRYGAGDGQSDDGGDEGGDDPEDDVDSEAEQDPGAIVDIAASREFTALLEESLVALEKQAKAGKAPPPPAPPPEPVPAAPAPPPGPPDSPNTSDISLSPLGSELCSSASEAASAPASVVPSVARSDTGRADADEVLEVPGGTIRFYKKTNNFTATCANHCKCVKTRQSGESKAASKTPSNLAKGRPLGFLAAWLAFGQEVSCDTKKKHWHPPTIIKKCDLATRVVKRLELALLPGGDAMLAHERPTRAGEGDEPVGLA